MSSGCINKSTTTASLQLLSDEIAKNTSLLSEHKIVGEGRGRLVYRVGVFAIKRAKNKDGIIQNTSECTVWGMHINRNRLAMFRAVSKDASICIFQYCPPVTPEEFFINKPNIKYLNNLNEITINFPNCSHDFDRFDSWGKTKVNSFVLVDYAIW